MDPNKRWKTVKELKPGGQGRVFTVIDSEKIDIQTQIKDPIEKAIRNLAGSTTTKVKNIVLNEFISAIDKIHDISNPDNFGALKILHTPEDARDFELAKERIKNEIESMSSISHPNLIKILDSDPESLWFVSQYHEKGTLTDNRQKYIGNFEEALRALKPLVEGVAMLHKEGKIHRDIKPGNIFIDKNDNLILGDFGLIYFEDDDHTRISSTFGNVGSRDWEPGWAQGKRVDNVSPAFDIFGLGKVLWYMVSGLDVLPLWYFDGEDSNVETLFPDSPFIWLANDIFGKCIVQFEAECLNDSSEFLTEIDNSISIIKSNADRIGMKKLRKCKICGLGKYLMKSDGNQASTKNFGGIQPTASNKIMLFRCDYCGNLQLFHYEGKDVPKIWENNS